MVVTKFSPKLLKIKITKERRESIKAQKEREKAELKAKRDAENLKKEREKAELKAKRDAENRKKEQEKRWSFILLNIRFLEYGIVES